MLIPLTTGVKDWVIRKNLGKSPDFEVFWSVWHVRSSVDGSGPASGGSRAQLPTGRRPVDPGAAKAGLDCP